MCKMCKNHWRHSVSTAADHRNWCGTRWRKTGPVWRTLGCENPQPTLRIVCSGQRVPVRDATTCSEKILQKLTGDKNKICDFTSSYLSCIFSKWAKVVVLILRDKGSLRDTTKAETNIQSLYFMTVTSHRKNSECCLSDALFTNSPNGRVLWGGGSAADTLSVCLYIHGCVFLCDWAHLYAKFLRRKSSCGTADTWIFTSLSPPFCLRYSTVHFSRQGPRLTPLSTAGLRWRAKIIRGITPGQICLWLQPVHNQCESRENADWWKVWLKF